MAEGGEKSGDQKRNIGERKCDEEQCKGVSSRGI
jgi:hypothetical protein